MFMKRQINFVVCSNDDQEMIVNFYPPLVIDDDEDTPYKFTKWGQIKEALSELLIYYDGNPARVTAFDEEAIGLLEDRDDKQVDDDHICRETPHGATDVLFTAVLDNHDMELAWQEHDGHH